MKEGFLILFQFVEESFQLFPIRYDVSWGIGEEILMTVTVLVSAAGHVVVAGIDDYLLLLPILYSLCLQQAPQQVMVFFLVE